MKKFDKHITNMNVRMNERNKLKLNANVQKIIKNVVPIYEDESDKNSSKFSAKMYMSN
jgi:hypothetical protein